MPATRRTVALESTMRTQLCWDYESLPLPTSHGDNVHTDPMSILYMSEKVGRMPHYLMIFFFFFHRHMTSQLILFHISFRFSFVKIHKVRAACFRFVRRIVCSTLFQSSNDNPIERTGSVLASPLPVQYHTLRHDPILNSRLEFK